MLFFAAVALLGAGVRLHRAADRAAPAARASEGLRRQIAEVDSARQERSSRSSRSSRTSRQRKQRRPSTPSTSSTPSTTSPLDLDLASAESLERLPRIGPALAKRIVADRDSAGPFGSLEGFQRVKGVGPAMAQTLAPYVTFSGTPRPSPVGARVSTRRRVSSREPRDARVPP
jgi:DNA uptake protein ComE-like DNA-binding protein